MKTTLDFHFCLYQAFKRRGYTKTRKQREYANLKKLLNNYVHTCSSKKSFLTIKTSIKSRLYYIDIIAYPHRMEIRMQGNFCIFREKHFNNIYN